jgi:hypothetical protein
MAISDELQDAPVQMKLKSWGIDEIKTHSAVDI